MAQDQKLATEHESREVAEQAREKDWEKQSFARALFEGRFDLGLIHPQPEPDPEEQRRAKPFLEKLEAFARDHIDGDRIDREGHVPQSVLDGLAELGAFGIKTPEEYESFQALNGAYKKKFGFPFVMAVKGSDRQAILTSFADRIGNDAETEFDRAIEEIHRIARFRLEEILQGDGTG